MNFTPLFSGSSGNCYLLEENSTKILIDAGKSGKKIEEGLQKLGININSINAIVLSHEHSDHSQSINILSKRHSIPIYISDKVLKNKNDIFTTNTNLIHSFTSNEDIHIEDVNIHTFSTSHDAIDPVAFSFFDNNKNKKISLATDLGYYDENIITNLENSDLVILESNYEENILAYSSYPYYLKERIASNKGHLSNKQMSELLKILSNKDIKNFIFAHLSKENNMPELVKQTAVNVFNELNIIHNINFSIANRDTTSDTIKI